MSGKRSAKAEAMKREVRAVVKHTISQALKKALAKGPVASPALPLDKYPPRMRLDQVAAFLNCSVTNVRNLVDAGELQGVNIAPVGSKKKRLRIQRDSVIQYETRQKEAAI